MIVQKMTSSVRVVAPSATALVDPGEMHEGSNGEEGQRNSPSDADSLVQVRPSLPRCTRHRLHHRLSLFPSLPLLSCFLHLPLGLFLPSVFLLLPTCFPLYSRFPCLFILFFLTFDMLPSQCPSSLFSLAVKAFTMCI